jgi:hypothetical protein
MSEENLEKVIERRLKREKAEVRKERARERVENRKLEEYDKFERGHRDEKLKILEGIYDWVGDFVGTNSYKKLLKLKENRIDIHGGKWGHKLDGDNHGCWSYVTLHEDAKLEYNAGYKWMGINENFLINEENIDLISLDYLKDFSESLESGRVYDWMKRWLGGEMENDLILKFRAKKKERRKR